MGGTRDWRNGNWTRKERYHAGRRDCQFEGDPWGPIVRLDECHECATINSKGHDKSHHLDPDSPWFFLHESSIALSWLPAVLSLSPFLGLPMAVEMKTFKNSYTDLPLSSSRSAAARTPARLASSAARRPRPSSSRSAASATFTPLSLRTPRRPTSSSNPSPRVRPPHPPCQHRRKD